MLNDDHNFESSANAGGASYIFPQQASTIRVNGCILIKNRPCKVVEISTSKNAIDIFGIDILNHGHVNCHFVAIDIFDGKKLEETVPSSHVCDVPHVQRRDYTLVGIDNDYVNLLDSAGNMKDDVKLPADQSLAVELKNAYEGARELIATVLSAMGEEQICSFRDT